MFFVRSAFWLTLVFSAMPFEPSEIARAIDQAKAGLPASAATTERLAALTNTPDGSLIAAIFFGLALCGPGHFDGLRSTSMVAMSRPI